MHQQIASQFGVSDDLPCADAKLLVPLKRSAEYGAIRPRVANPKAADSWQEDGLHFFVFQLKGGETTPAGEPVAVFAMHPESPMPVSAVVVSPTESGEQAEVMDLRAPDSTYSVPLETGASLLEPVARAADPAPRTEVPPQRPPAVDSPASAAAALLSAGGSKGPGATAAAHAPDQAATTAPAPLAEAPSEPMPALDGQTATTPAAPAPDGTEHATTVEPAPSAPASVQEQTAAQSSDSESMSGGNLTLLVALKRSVEYEVIRQRLANSEPIDAWQEDGLHFFAFQLQPAADVGTIPPEAEPPTAVFALRPDLPAPLSAVILIPKSDGTQPEIINLRGPNSTDSVPPPIHVAAGERGPSRRGQEPLV